jgi:CBS-domain-containing membrane protein
MSARDLVTIDGNAPASAAFALMQHHRLRRVPVVEPDGRVIGVVALARVRDDLGALPPGLRRAHLRRPRAAATAHTGVER